MPPRNQESRIQNQESEIMPESTIDRSAIDTLRAEFQARLTSASSDKELKALTDDFLSRKSGSVTGLLKNLGALPPGARREYGQLVNTLKSEIETALEEKRGSLESSRPPAGAVDVTLPGRE